jgi:hypothetical protein
MYTCVQQRQNELWQVIVIVHTEQGLSRAAKALCQLLALYAMAHFANFAAVC